MKLFFRAKIPLTIIAGLVLCGPAIAKGRHHHRVHRVYAEEPIRLVPYCTPDTPYFGLSCIPHAAAPEPYALLAAQETLEYSYSTLRRPYRQTFVWP